MDYGDFLERWMSWVILKSVTTVYYPSIENYGFAPSIDRKPGHLGPVFSRVWRERFFDWSMVVLGYADLKVFVIPWIFKNL